MIYNREEALSVLGHCCNDLNLLRSRNYKIVLNDFDTKFHKILFGALQNLALEKSIKEVDGFTIDNYLSKYPVQYETFKSNNGFQTIEELKVKYKATSFDYSYKMLKKFSLLRRFHLVGMDISEIFDFNSLDPKKIEEQTEKIEKASIDDIKNYFKLKLIEIDEEFQTKGDSYTIDVKSGLEELIEKCKQGENWGITFQSELFNAVFKGMRGSKLMIRSAGTGGSKTRQSLGDMANISVPMRYSRRKGKWIKNDKTVDSLFISTELVEEELQLALLSTIGGVPEENLTTGECTEEEWQRVEIAKEQIKFSKIKIEYASNFSLSELENIIEKYIISFGVKYIFFDYIQITSNLSSELNRLFGYTLREDQQLQQLSNCLKNLCNKYNVFILTSTQLNRNHKFDGILDATHLRGGMAVLDKADYGIITMSITGADKEKLQAIMPEDFKDYPTHAHHIIKNRGGKWVAVILWVDMDLDTIEVDDCFVTTQDFVYIPEVKPHKIT